MRHSPATVKNKNLTAAGFRWFLNHGYLAFAKSGLLADVLYCKFP